MTTATTGQALAPEEFLDSLFQWQSETVRRPKLWEEILAGRAGRPAIQAYLKEKFFLHWHSEPKSRLW